MGVRPQLQALMLADHIYVDAATGKKIIAGTFNRLASEEFPTDSGHSKYALLSMTDVHGSADLVLRFVDLKTNDTLLEMQGLHADAGNPLETVEMVVQIPPLPIPHAGAYAFEVLCDEELVGSLRLLVDAHPAESEASSDP